MQVDIKEEIKRLRKFYKKDILVNAAYWLAFVMFILAFVFNEYQQEFIRALLFIAGFLYGKEFAEKKTRNYIENYKLPGMPYEPGKFLDLKEYRKAFPGFTKLFIKVVLGILIGTLGASMEFALMIYLGPLITGVGIGEIIVHRKVKKVLKSNPEYLLYK